jgi:mannose-6-phosphate isomerase-like protein (cupin superfamily)
MPDRPRTEDPTPSPAPAKILKYARIDWDNPLATSKAGTAPPRALVEEARRVGARRKKLVRGEAGFYMNRSLLPPGYRVPPHHHNHDEMLIILSGGCVFEDDFGEAGPDDTVVIPAKNRYGFVCGPEGMEFLTIRLGEATTEL